MLHLTGQTSGMLIFGQKHNALWFGPILLWESKCLCYLFLGKKYITAARRMLFHFTLRNCSRPDGRYVRLILWYFYLIRESILNARQLMKTLCGTMPISDTTELKIVELTLLVSSNFSLSSAGVVQVGLWSWHRARPSVKSTLNLECPNSRNITLIASTKLFVINTKNTWTIFFLFCPIQESLQIQILLAFRRS